LQDDKSVSGELPPAEKILFSIQKMAMAGLHSAVRLPMQ
jgi:hypothetical protein